MSIQSNGEPSRARTCDPLIKSQLLYQLSYRPTAEVKIIRRRTTESRQAFRKTHLECGDSSPLSIADKSAHVHSGQDRYAKLGSAATSRRGPKALTSQRTAKSAGA